MEIITGTITANALVKSVNGKEVINFSVAINSNYRKKSTDEIVQKVKFYDCGYWSSSKISEYLTKGKIVQLVGDTTAKAWQDKEGKLHAGLVFTVFRIKLLGGGTKREEAIINEEPVTGYADGDEVPF